MGVRSPLRGWFLPSASREGKQSSSGVSSISLSLCRSTDRSRSGTAHLRSVSPCELLMGTRAAVRCAPSSIGDRRRRAQQHFRNVPVVPAGPLHQRTMVPGASPAPEPWDSWPHADPGGHGAKGQLPAPGTGSQERQRLAGCACACTCMRVQGEQAWQLAIGKCEARSCLRDGRRNVLSRGAADRLQPPARALQQAAEAWLQPTPCSGVPVRQAIKRFLNSSCCGK